MSISRVSVELCLVLLVLLVDSSWSADEEGSGEAEPRWLGDTLRDTDASLQNLLSQPVDKERVEFVFKFVLGYKGLLEKLISAAQGRDPRSIEVFRELRNRGGRPGFTSLLSDLSVRQDQLNWSNEDMDVLRTQVLQINKLVDQFTQAVIHLMQN